MSRHADRLRAGTIPLAVLSLLLVVAVVTASGAVAADEPIRETAHYELTPDRPGRVVVTLAYTTPDPLAEFSVDLPPSPTVIAAEGFTAEDGRYVWDGETDRPRLRVRLPVNETGREFQRGTAGSSPVADRVPGGAGLIFVDAGDWALFTRPSTTIRWSTREHLDFERATETEGPGIAGSTLVFLGEHRTVTRTVDGCRFTYVVPAGTDPAVDPATTLDALAFASREVRVGAHPDHVLAVAAPTTVNWGVAGLQVGRSDFWVRADQPLGPGSTWYHEYVHVRQGFRTRTATAWTTEGMATYYAALLGLKNGGSFEAFQARLAPGTADRYDDVVLADPTTWHDDAPYRKGALAIGHLDRRIRLASDGSSFQRVWSALNRESDPIAANRLYTAVGAAGNDSLAVAARQYAESPGGIEMWSAREHRAAFGGSGPHFQITHATAVTVTGEYRTTAIDPDRTAVVGPDESVTITYRVSNVGDVAGQYAVPVRLGNRTVDRLTGTLDVGESVTHEVSVTPNRTGRVALYAGNSVLDLRVVRPPVRVVDLTVTSTGTTTVTATVAGNATLPTTGRIAIRWDDRTILDRTVTIAPGENRTLTAAVPNATAGEHTVHAGNATATVTITESTPTGGPAVGPLAALVVIVLVGRACRDGT
ncbi:MAG: hypothetical protein ABEJ86_01425 [Halococcoides sp.]